MDRHIMRELAYEDGTIIVAEGELNEHVGFTNGSFYEGSETQHEYGRLFAAAPDLLKACVDADKLLDKYAARIATSIPEANEIAFIRRMIKRAIAKAKPQQ